MTTTRADSPCIGICIYDYDRDYCAGCGRTLEEISYWKHFTSKEKEQILKDCKKNLDSHPERCYNANTQGGSDGPD